MMTESKTLSAKDRCDACGARAYVRAEFASGPLYFCAHHARKHASAIAVQSVSLRDETEQLAAESADQSK